MARSVINVKILGDNRDLRVALDDSSSRLSRFASGAGRALGVGAAGLTAMGAAAVTLGPQLLDAGNALEAINAKSSTVFGDSLGDMRDWAQGVAGSMGLTTDQLVGAAAGMGDLLKPMGFTEEQAASMSAEMLDLSGALSAWSAGQYDAAEVSEILSKAMLGEREQLKALGISISEADVQARLAAKGQEDLTGAALAQAKALATQELILERSTDAQAAWNDGTFDSIKASNEANASIEQIKETLLQAAVPALQAVVPLIESMTTWLGERLPPAIAAVREWFDENWPAIQAVIESVSAYVAQLVNQYWPAIRDTIVAAMEAVWAVIDRVVTVVSGIWDRWGANIMALVQDVWPQVETVIGGALEVIQGVFEAFTALFEGDWSALWDAVKRIAAGALLALKGALSLGWIAIKAAVSVAWEGIKALVRAALDAVVGFVSGLPGQLVEWGTDLYNAGKDLFGRLADGLIDALAGLPGAIADKVLGPLDDIALKVVDVLGLGGSAGDAIREEGAARGVPGFGGPGDGFIDDAALLDAVPQYHTGGIVGRLGGPPRDVPILAQEGEYVLSRSDVDNILSGGRSGGPLVGTVIVNDGRSIESELRLIAALHGGVPGMAAA